MGFLMGLHVSEDVGQVAHLPVVGPFVEGACGTVKYIFTTSKISIFGDFLIFNLLAISLLYAAKVSNEKLVSNSLL